MIKLLILAVGLVLGSIITFGIFVISGDLSPKEKFSSNEKYMAEILKGQLEIANADLACDIDFLSQYHDKPICLSKLDAITQTQSGYILHAYKTSAMMWMDDGEVVKMRGTNGSKELEYNGTVKLIKLDNTDYYLITKGVFQGNEKN